MRLRFGARGSARVSTLAALAAAVLVAGAFLALRSARRAPGPRAAAGAGGPLFRPLARGPDARFAGRLPSVHGVRNDPRTPEGVRLAGARIERLWEEVGDPSDIAAFLDAQERLLWIGMGGGVEGAARAVLAVDPAHARATALLAAFRYEQGRRSEVLPLAEEALRRNPSEYLALVYRAEERAADGDLVSALADLTRAEASDPARPEASAFLGSILFERYRFKEALPPLRRAFAHDPPGAPGRGLYVRLADAYLDLLDGREALAVPAVFDPVEVPLELRPQLPSFPVRVNGKEDGWMILDSGSDVVRIPRRRRAIAEVREDAALETLAAGDSRPVAHAGILDSIEIGGLVVRNVPVRVEAEEFEEPEPEILGAIGSVFLSRFHATADLLEGRLELAPPGRGLGPALRGTIGAEVVTMGETPFRRMNNQILVRGRLGSGPERTFMLDTGASALAIDRAVLREEFGVAEGDPRTTPVTARGIAGRPVPSFWFPLPAPLVFGNTPVHGLVALAEDFADRNLLTRTDIAGVIGLDLLSSASVGLDFERHRVSFILRGARPR